MTCLDDNAMVELADGQLAPPHRERALRHLESCAPCRRTVARALRTLEPLPAPASEVAPFSIDRYRVIDWLGEGAMGVVYRAHDPRIDREVALKVVLPERTEPAALARLLREARVLGRVSHPNVLAVYDAGAIDDAVFVASELVDGTDLRTALARRQHSVAEVVELFRQAALGLHAAHRVGLVHLDVKPDNLLVGADGRVRVADFGLAAVEGEHDAASGTRGYMAPEQRAGRSVDARADQYGLCVSLHEALFGTLPGAGAVTRAVPRNVRAALQRGLSAAPADRFVDMLELRDALAPSRRRSGLAIAALTLGGAAIAIAATRSEARPPAPELAQHEHEPDPALERARQLRLAGDLEGTIAEARAVAARARAEDDLPQLAEAELLLGKAMAPSPQHADTQAVLLRAIDDAVAAGREDLHAEGLIALAAVETRDPSAAPRARMMLAQARRILADRGLQARLGHTADYVEGTIDFVAGHHEDAVVALERAYDGVVQALPAGHPFIAQYRWTLATALARVARHDEAAVLYEQSRREAEATLDARDPQYGLVLAAIGAQRANAGDYAAGLVDLRAAADILREGLGEDSQATLDVRGDIAICLGELGRHDEARAELRDVLARTLVAGAPGVIAEAYAELGDEELRAGAPDAARPAYDEALAWARRGASGTATEARMLTRVGIARVEGGDFVAAREPLEAALALHELEGGANLDIAETELALAQVLTAESIDRARAIALAESARERVGGRAAVEVAHRVEIDAWLREQLGDA